MFSLQKLLGKEDKFFDLLESSAEEGRASVQALIKLVKRAEEARTLEDFVAARRKEKRIAAQISQMVAGGLRIIRTLGHKMVKLQPINGFAAETSSALVIFLATHLGIPVSTTHNISAAIMGVGAAKRFGALNFSVIEKMLWAWILTIPICGTLAYGFVRILEYFRLMD